MSRSVPRHYVKKPGGFGRAFSVAVSFGSPGALEINIPAQLCLGLIVMKGLLPGEGNIDGIVSAKRIALRKSCFIFVVLVAEIIEHRLDKEVELPCGRQSLEDPRGRPDAERVVALQGAAEDQVRVEHEVRGPEKSAWISNAPARIHPPDKALFSVRQKFLFSARVHLPGNRLKELIAGRERDDVDQAEALQTGLLFVEIVPPAQVKKIYLRPFHVSAVRVHEVVIRRPPDYFRKVRAGPIPGPGAELARQMPLVRRNGRNGNSVCRRYAERAPGVQGGEKLLLVVLFFDLLA